MAVEAAKRFATQPFRRVSSQRTFFLCRSAKTELASLSLSQETFNMFWDEVVQTIDKDDFADALQRQMTAKKYASESTVSRP
jgi:hypothetical protein